MQATTVRPHTVSQSRDDRVLIETRLVSALVIVVLILAVWILYFHPDETAQSSAWTIKPQMTALALGAGYAMGAYFFARTLTSQRWHRSSAGLIPITAFTVCMALATLIHWDRFNQTSFSFLLWVVLYAATPVLVPLLWVRNRATDPGTPEPGDLRVSRAIRWTAGLAGLTIALVGVGVFLTPDLAIRSWPWTLTPLTARVLAGWAMLPGVGGLALAREPRWSGWRTMVESLLVGGILFLIGAARAWSDWRFDSPASVLIAAGLVVALGALLLTFLYVELRGRNPARPTQPPAALSP